MATVRKQKQKKESGQLSSNFTFWLQQFQKSKTQSYCSALKELITVTNIKQFWEFFQFLKRTNDLPTHSDFFMFKPGIKPEWQDKQNAGCFKIKIEKVKSNKLWQNSIFAMASPSNRLIHLINGVRIKIRQKIDQVEIWLPKIASDKEKFELVKNYFKQNLQVTDQRIFSFCSFQTKQQP